MLPIRQLVNSPTRQLRRKQAFTLIEAMILVTILSIVAVAAAVGLQSLAKVPMQNDDILAINSKIIDRMEQMKSTAASNFSNLSTQATSLTNTSPGILINGKYYSCTVAVAQANPDGSGNKSDFYLITITIGSRSMSTYVMQP